MKVISAIPPAVRAGVLMLAVLLLTAFVIRFVAGRDEAGLTTVNADFTDSSPLLTGNEVRLDGVKVGVIKSMRVKGDHARLTLSLESSALPLYTDATLASRPVSILGERYLDLDPGTSKAPELHDGGLVPMGQTSSATDLDQVLNVLDKPTSQSLAALVTALGVGVDGNGKDIAAAVAALAPAMQDTQQLTSVLRSQNETLGSLVDSMEPVAEGLAADNGQSLDAMVSEAEQTLRSTTTSEAAFRSLLRQLPATLRSATITLAHLQGTADAAVPTLEGLQPTTQNLNEISTELTRFADAADPALKSATPVLKEAQRLVEAAQPVADQLHRSGGDLTRDTVALDPITKKLTADITAVMEFFKGWALATNGSDGLSHYFRAGLVVSPDTATGVLPSTNGQRPPNPFDPNAEEPNRPKDEKATKGKKDPLGQLLDGGGAGTSLLAPRTTKDGGVTGLDESQERGVLEYLLGGS